MNRRLRIAIEANVGPPGRVGGGEQFLISLLKALALLDEDGSDYLVVGAPDHFLEDLIWNGNLNYVPATSSGSEAFKRGLGPLRKPLGLLRRRLRQSKGEYSLPRSNGFLESLAPDLVHFPLQSFTQVELPTVYNPHDLQHIHFPEFFQSSEVAWRDFLIREACNRSSAVATPSEWVKEDIVEKFGIPAGKVHAILYGSPVFYYPAVSLETIARVKRKFGIERPYILYPAQTWPHKNHLRLLEALRLLKDSGSDLNLVCTGRKNRFWPKIRRSILQLKLESSSKFVGYVQAQEIRALYAASEFVVFPSIFEGGGLPILEAMSEGKAVACSNVTAIPEYAGDAALYFDPFSVDALADALTRLSGDPQLRVELEQRGSERVQQFSWERAAREYQEVYSLVVG